MCRKSKGCPLTLSYGRGLLKKAALQVQPWTVMKNGRWTMSVVSEGRRGPLDPLGTFSDCPHVHRRAGETWLEPPISEALRSQSPPLIVAPFQPFLPDSVFHSLSSLHPNRKSPQTFSVPGERSEGLRGLGKQLCPEP